MSDHKNAGHSHDHPMPQESPVEAEYVHVNDANTTAPTNAPLTDESRLAVRKLVMVTVIALIFMLMEFIGGYIAGSLAVISDAVHMLTDVLGFVISLTAIWIGRKPASDRLTFGFHRVEIVGALVSIMVIWVLTGILVYSAVLRFVDFLEEDAKQVVDGQTMFIIALIGLVMNIVMMKVLGGDGHGHSHGGGGHGHSHGAAGHDHNDHETGHGHSHSHSHGHDDEHDDHEDHSGHDHEDHGHTETEDHEASQRKKSRLSKLWASKFENLNIQAAYLHVLGDLLQSVGVTIAGALIWWKPSWQLADPIMTFVFSLLVIATTVGTVKESLRILMEGTPRGVEPAKIESGLRSCTAVAAVHDLHIWSLSTSKPALAVHLVSDDPDTALASAQDYLIGKGITHTTIQIERPATAYPQQCASGGRCV